jgi:carboxyl-terminal processing protease
MRFRRPTYLLAPIFIVLCSIVAGLLGGGGRASAASSPDDAVNQSLKSFTKIYDAVEQNFADQVKPDKAIYDGAIPAMLHELDPHSNFFDPKEFAKLREDQSGHYAGIGMMVGSRGNRTIVQYPFEGSPAFRAGLRPGDAILEVNDQKTDSLSMSEVAERLKGPKGTKVQVMISRDGHDKPLTFNITRDEIPRSSVPFAFFVRPGIAYAVITAFNENTGKELDEKLKKLGEKDIKGMILDLRGNPGGLLNEGIDVASHFLKKGETVVSSYGRASPRKVYAARADGSGKDYPIVVLVNRSTASAAEIVSGALQDHDRGWILGEPTFGKGLVQQVFTLNDNTGLALTMAHYYTPSGRLIQRDYSAISFLDYYAHTNLDQKNSTDVKMTDSGRTVYGGGGITPDERYTCATANWTQGNPYLCSTEDKFNKFQAVVLRSNLFNFAAHFFGPRPDASLPKGWEPDENVVNQFHDFLLDNKADFSEADFTANHDWLKRELKRELYITAFSFEDSERAAIEQDPEVLKALDSMSKAKGLLDNAKKLLVQRIGAQRVNAQSALRPAQ